VEGWLFADGDAQALADAILQALEMAKKQPEKYTAVRRSARQRAEARADWQKNFTVLQQAYQAALRHSGRSITGGNESAA
jgi:glycosyltransferase involved in cell wall biosynthesis